MKHEYKDVLKNSTLLLVDDNITLRKKFLKIFSLYIDNIYEATNGKEAYSMYQELKPSIIVTDIKMPELNGLDFISLVRTEDVDTLIVVTTALNEQKYLLKSIKLMLTEYLIKPVIYDDILSTLEVIAGKLLKNPSLRYTKLENDYYYNNVEKCILYKDTSIKLTNKEVLFIELLIQNKGWLVTKNQLENELYTYEEITNSKLKNIVFKLRKKLHDPLIVTVSHLGYKLN